MTSTTQRDSGDSAPETVLPREAYTLLAQANLLRMRGRWNEAVEICMTALRLAPQNASAQSLLGDIYENQGHDDDAIQWYRMALDVNPDSPADRLKLDRLLEARRRRLAGVPTYGEDTPAIPITMVAPSPAPRYRNPEVLLRWGAWVIVLLAVMVVGLAGLTMAHGHLSAEPELKAPPVVLPAATASQPSQQDAPAAADPSEQALLRSLQQDESLATQNVVPVSVQMDPRQGSITITILCSMPTTGTSLREQLLSDSLSTLRIAAHSQGDHVRNWTVRCLLPPAAGAPEAAPGLSLVADAAPGALATPATDAAPTGPQTAAVFHDTWWSPSIP